jgi:hypothetical protein
MAKAKQIFGGTTDKK